MSVRANHAPSPVLRDASAPGVRPLRHWRAAECCELRDALEEMLDVWAEDWHLHATGSAAREAPVCVSELPIDPLQWRRIDAAPSSNLCWAFARTGELAPTQLLRSALFGEPRSVAASNAKGDRIADRLAQAAWHDWRGRLCVLFGDLPAAAADAASDLPQLPAEFTRPWAGAIVCRLSWCGEAAWLAVGGDCVARWLGRRRPSNADEAAAAMPRARSVIPVWQAMRASRLPLSVELDPIEIDLATLSTLRVGDVLRTAHGLETALRVRLATSLAGDAFLCDGFLGRQGHARAVELLPARFSEPSTST